MKVAVIGLAACLLSGGALAQQQPPAAAKPPPSNTTVVPPVPPNASAPNAGAQQSHNPAVAATSNENDTAEPAKGSNSFTENQAKSRITDRGFSDVADLKKDDDGIWHGTAKSHDDQPVKVWLDYKGNVGETK